MSEDLTADLWRAVIRPLLAETVERLLYDSTADTVAERALAASDVTLDAVAPGPALDVLLATYPDRFFVHASAVDAWEATQAWDLAVLDASRELRTHIEMVRREATAGGQPPAMVIHGMGGRPRTAGEVAAQDPTSALFAEHGWTVLEVPGFSDARIVVPTPGCAVGLRAWTLVEELAEAHSRHAARPGIAGRTERAVRDRDAGSLEEAGVDGLEQPLEALRHERDQLRSRESAAQQAVAALRASNGNTLARVERIDNELTRSNDELMQALERLGELEQLRQTLNAVTAERDALRSDRDRQRSDRLVVEADRRRLEEGCERLEGELHSLDELRRASASDLQRVAESQSWRVGHFLTRAARVLTFRRPGRTDGLRRTAERLEKWALRE